MENETAETTKTPAAEPTPAPAVAVAEKAPEAAAPAAATETKQPQTETAPGPKDFFKQREAKREQKLSEQQAQRIATLEKQLAERETAKPNEPEPPSFLDDPEKWAASVTEKAKAEAAKSYAETAARSKAEADYQQSAEKAEKWLLTRSHLKQDPALETELAKIIGQRYGHIAEVDPQGAAELGYLALCRSKGIAPDMDGFSTGSSNQAAKGATSSGARPSAAATGKRIFARGEGEKYIYAAPAGTPERRARLAEVEEAQRDGRIK